MQQSVEMLLKKMSEDKAFAEKVLSQTEKEKVIEIAKEEGIELTMEGIDEANEIIGKALQLKNEGELSEEDLEKVAGGSDLLVTLVTVSSAVTSVVTSVATSVSTVITSVSTVSAISGITAASAYMVTISREANRH